MQTAKSRNGSLDRPQKTSPATPRTARTTKPAVSDSRISSPVPSPNHNRNLKNCSPKTVDRASPRSPIPEKKRISKVSELESQLAQLREELKRAKEHLSSFEAQKRQAQQEAEETRKQISSLSAKLEESREQLVELSDSEEARLQELRKISHERDQVWQSELEALQKQHALDSADLASAMIEIQRLKKQLEIVAESEATQSRHAESAHAEIQNLRIELSETLELVQEMRSQLAGSKESEVRAFEVASEAQAQLEATKATAEAIQSDRLKAMEAYNSLASELEQSKAQVSTLENLVSQLQADVASSDPKTSADSSGGEDMPKRDGHKDKVTNELKLEIDSLKLEVAQLKSALEASEVRYQEEYIQSTLQIRSAYEAVERAKIESSHKETELEEELKNATDAIEHLKTELTSKQNSLQYISHENEELSIRILGNQTSIKESELRVELKKLEVDLTHLKSALLDRETHIQTLAEENETLRTEISERETDRSRLNEEAVAVAQAAKSAEKEALMKLCSATEEADKSNRRATKVVEQLQAAQNENSELESELRRLKVQADQWRKAAEAAAAMLSPRSDAKLVDRTISLDSSYHHTIGMRMDSPFSDHMDDDSPKKKNANMLKKIGGLWKKGQK